MQECPNIPATRIVLQDLPTVIRELELVDPADLRDLRIIEQDFFKEQLVKGALVYYIRRVIHNWSDKYACRIVGQIRDVMAPESRTLIIDQVMTKPPPPESIRVDLIMLGMGAQERTEKDWHALANSVGLDILDIWKSSTNAMAVIELKKK